LESNIVSCHKDELPPEGLGHNRALNITIRCRDEFVSKVLIENVSTVNICPFITLRALGIDIGKVRESNVRVKGFDRTQRWVIGEINLALQIIQGNPIILKATEFVSVLQSQIEKKFIP